MELCFRYTKIVTLSQSGIALSGILEFLFIIGDSYQSFFDKCHFVFVSGFR